ncbi:MAG: RQC domain-containing protein, partial [Patescibacteria group bacterium]
AFGMGIDKPNVRLVVHMDMPKTLEAYYQETGRAGRDGRPSDCILFFSLVDRRKHQYFIDQIEDLQERDRCVQKLKRVIDYGQTTTCRRQFILDYFGEVYPDTSCTACDNCLPEPLASSLSSQATCLSRERMLEEIVRGVSATGGRFGVGYICDLLHGSRNKRILENQHNHLSVHGTLRQMPVGDIRVQLSSLIRTGHLEKIGSEYPTVRVSKLGRDLLAHTAEA